MDDVKRWVVFFLLLLTCNVHAQTPLKRADSFFGIGFDFNADSKTTNIGYGLHPQDIDTFLVAIKPDFIQIDTKGDYGYASYPSQIGVSAPQIVLNPLPVFRVETARYGVGLYAHYCALYDGAAVAKHPDWGRLTATNTQDSLAVSLFSPYVDNYFIPQLKEIASYSLDGLWIDSDNWVVLPDYSANASTAYSLATHRTLPRSYADTAMHSYVEFTRQAYHTYLNHYVDMLHTYKPALQICTSWGYAYMMGPIDAKVDFLSGDLKSTDLNEYEYHSRLLGAQDRPWDLMAWVTPTAAPLERQASVVLAQGGAFQVYIVQNRDASIPTVYNPQVKATADFCRARKDYCFKTTPIPQVAVFISSYGYNKEASSIFSISEGNLTAVKHMMSMYLDLHYSVQVLQEHEFNADLSVYPMIVIPGWQDIEPTFLAKLKQYVNNGGKLFIIGQGANALFADIETKYTTIGNTMHLPVLLYQYGTGSIAAIPVDFYNIPTDAATVAFEKSLYSTLAQTLFPKPMITVTGQGNYHINATTKNGENLFHFVHLDNNATKALTVKLRLAKKPSAILLQPGNVPVDFTYTGGLTRLTLPPLGIYSILELKN